MLIQLIALAGLSAAAPDCPLVTRADAMSLLGAPVDSVSSPGPMRDQHTMVVATRCRYHAGSRSISVTMLEYPSAAAALAAAEAGSERIVVWEVVSGRTVAYCVQKGGGSYDILHEKQIVSIGLGGPDEVAEAAGMRLRLREVVARALDRMGGRRVGGGMGGMY